METQRPDSGANASEGKIDRGWRLTQVAWKLMRQSRTMLILALVGIGCATIFTALIFYFGGYFSHPQHPGTRFAVVALVALYPSVLVSVFFNVALATAANAMFDGERMSVGEALRIAYGKRKRIALWALLTAFVGMMIAEIANRLPGGGRLAGWLMGAAWGLATIFVVPILAMESIGAIDAGKRSAKLVKSRWGEGLSGNVAIGAWAVVVSVPMIMLITVGAALDKSHPETAIALIVAGLVSLVAISALVSATRQVFAVALYRFAINAPIGGFSAADLEYPFTPDPSRKKRKSWILRIGVPIIALFVILGIVSALVNHRSPSQTGAEGYWHFSLPKTKTTNLAVGSPVVAGGRQIGSIVEVSDNGSSVSIGFQVDPVYDSLVQSKPAFTAGPRSHQYVCVGTRRECNRGSPSSRAPQLNPPLS